MTKIKSVDSNKNIEASAFSGGSGTSSDPYKITTYNNWRDFVSSVSNGNNYSGKYIRLGYNVDWFGNSVLPIGCLSTGTFSGKTTIFKGKFDGRGYTISNFTLKGMEYSDAIDYDVNLKVNGLFGIIGDGAEIKNLCLNNFKVQMPTGGGIDNIYVGGLVGQYSGSGSASINSCAIKNMEVIKSSGVTNYNKYIGAIIGRKGSTGSITIQDCYVENFKVSLSGEDWYVDYTIAKVGPAFCTYRGSSTVKNCLVNGATISTSSSRDTTTYNIADAPSGYLTITSSYTAKQTAYSGWSIGSAGGSSGTTWYNHSSYNSGWPMLRVFMSWKTVNFTAGTGGSVSPTSIQIPSDSNPTATKSGVTIAILGQTSTATASSGYGFSSWTGSGTSYTANFVRLSATLTFANATGVKSGDSISPSGTSYTINQGDPITVSHTTGTGPLTLKYTFKNTSGTTCNVTYTIPEKYNLKDSKNPGSITSTTTITPEVEIKKFTVTLKAATGSNKTTDTVWTVEYNQSVTYNSTNHSFTYSGSTITYTASSGYRYDGLTIKRNNSTSNTNALTGITGNIEIQPVFARWYEVTFATIGNTTSPTSAQKIEVKENDSITQILSTDQKTLTYSYNGASVTYRASKFYILSNGSNVLKVTGTKTITPVTTFYACVVTMGSIETGVGTKTVSGDNYGTASDGIFAVEFGTTVVFSVERISAGMYKYIYTYSSGEVVSYSITNAEYAMQYTLNAEGERVSMSNGLNGTVDNDSYTFAAGTTSKSISPTFGKKQYVGELD